MARPVTFPFDAPGARETSQQMQGVAAALAAVTSAGRGAKQGLGGLKETIGAATSGLTQLRAAAAAAARTEVGDLGLDDLTGAAVRATRAMDEYRADVISGAAVTNEVRARMEQATDTLVEFGASADQVAAALARMEAAEASGARGKAQVANAIRAMADESERADYTLNNLGKAQLLAARAGEKLEDAARGVGAAARGDTRALQMLRGASARAASEIDKITDAKLRQRLVDQQLSKGLSGQVGLYDRVTNALGPMNVQLASMGLPTVSATAAIGGLTAGVGALVGGIVAAEAAVLSFTADAMEEFVETNTRATAAANTQADAWGRFKVVFGEQAATVGRYNEVQVALATGSNLLTQATEIQTRAYRENGYGIDYVTAVLGGYYNSLSASQAATDASTEAAWRMADAVRAEEEALASASATMLNDYDPSMMGVIGTAGTLANQIASVTGALNNQAFAAKAAAAALRDQQAAARSAEKFGRDYITKRYHQDEVAQFGQSGTLSSQLLAKTGFGDNRAVNEMVTDAALAEAKAARGRKDKKGKGGGGGGKTKKDEVSALGLGAGGLKLGKGLDASEVSFFDNRQIQDAIDYRVELERNREAARRFGEAIRAQATEKAWELGDALQQIEASGSVQALEKVARSSQRLKEAWSDTETDLLSRELDAQAASVERYFAALRASEGNTLFSAQAQEQIAAFNQRAAILEAQTQLYTQMGDAGVQAFSDVSFAAGQSFAMIAVGSKGAAKNFNEGLVEAMGLTVPVFQAFGSSLIAAKNLWGVGVLLGAGALAAALGRIKSSMSRGGSGGGATSLVRDTTIRNERARREQGQAIVIHNDLYYGDEFVKRKTTEHMLQAERLNQLRAAGGRG